MKHPTLALLLVVLATSSPADEITILPNSVSIPPGQKRAFEFGTVPQSDTTVLLEVSSRIHYRGLSGSTFFMDIVLNGQRVKAARTRRVVRLMNKPINSPIAPGLEGSWFGGCGWRVIYAPDFKSALKAKYYTSDPYTLVLDVTDLTNPAAENRLEITNAASKLASLRWTAPEGNLVLGRLIVRTKPGKSPTMTPAASAKPIINTGQPAAPPAAYRGELLPGGGFAVSTHKRRWKFASSFSYPDAGFNRLVPRPTPDRAGQPEWKVSVAATPDGGRVTAEGPRYRLSRTVRFTARKVEIADAITNANGREPLGLIVRHSMDMKAETDAAVRLAGNADPAVNDYYSPPNPSVHVALADHGVGLLCEDDVFRNQARLFFSAEPAEVGLRTEMLRLAPGETYTLRWSVYPVDGPDYFDFVNLVRQDWGSNFTVQGAWTFFNPYTILAMPIEELREHFRRLGIRRAMYCGGWVDYKKDRKRIGFGTGVLDDYWADFRATLKKAAARIREAAPDVKVMVYYDTQRDTSEGGHERFRDSWLTNPRGQQLSTEWSGRFSLTRSMVATLDNSYGKAMLRAVDRYFDEMQVDGLYWDEMECVAYGRPLITCNIPDGHSCLLDPKRHIIQREIGITTLLGQSHRLAVIDRAHKRGGLVMGNGPPNTRAILATGVPRMVEIQHNEHWCYEGNLGTPLGYLSSRTDFSYVVRAIRMACLPVSVWYDYPFEISRFLFPFTPIELHHGYLLGKERIVTLHPGSYGWPGQRPLVAVWHFNSEGQLTETDFPTVVTSEARTKVRPADGEVVVLERLPITLVPTGEIAQASQVRYFSEGLALRLTSERGATLKIADGPFQVEAGRSYAVQIGNEPAKPLAADGKTKMLSLTIGPGKDLPVKVFAK